MSYIYGFLEDNTVILLFSHLIKLTGSLSSSLINYPSGYSFFSDHANEPVLWHAFFFLARFFDGVSVYNIFILGGVFLSFLASLVFFHSFVKSRPVSLLLSLIFALSPYFYYRAQNHITLVQVWLLISFAYLLSKASKVRHYIFLGVLAAFATAVSNYIGYFILLYSGLYFLSRQIVERDFWNKKVVLNFSILYLTFSLLSVLFLNSYVKSSSDYERTVEEFVTFSSRPWYNLLPSTDNPLLGGYSAKVISFLENKVGTHLAANYFKSEHGTSYLGLVNLVLAGIGAVYIYKNKDKELMALGLVAIFLVILTMPPKFFVAGTAIYTPSYILFKVFPMFRVLSRLGIVILLIELIYTGFGYLQIISRVKRYKAIIPVLVMVSLAEFYIPVKVTNLSTPPQVYEYLKSSEIEEAPIVVYPYSKTTEALYWVYYYNFPLVNPRGFEGSEALTKSLTTCEGIKAAAELGARYLISFKDDTVADVDTKNLTKITGFDSAVLYGISPVETSQCE